MANKAYSRDITDWMLDEIAEGRSLGSVCSEANFYTKGVFMRWVINNNDDMATRYKEACEARANIWAEQIIDISDHGVDDEMVNDRGQEVPDHEVLARSKLRVQARQWMAERILNGQYGASKLGSKDEPLTVLLSGADQAYK